MEKKTVNVAVPVAMHRKLKLYAKKTRYCIRVIVENAILEYLKAEGDCADLRAKIERLKAEKGGAA